MTALFTVKSITLMQAAAQEPAANVDSKAAKSADATQPAAAPTSSAVRPLTEHVQKTDATLTATMAKPETASEPADLHVSESERQVLLSLRARREQLEARSRTLDEREAEIEAADKRLAERVQQLQTLQARLEGLEAGRQQHRAENWAGLVKTYESMKPREAAAIFDALDMQVLLQVLDRMQERRAAPVLAAMQPDRARLVTQLLAEMRNRATTPADQPQPPALPKG